MDGFGDVVLGDALTAFEVGERAGEAEDFVVGAGGKAHVQHRLLQQHLAGGVQRAELADLPAGHLRVGHPGVAVEAAALKREAVAFMQALEEKKHRILAGAEGKSLEDSGKPDEKEQKKIRRKLKSMGYMD